ncbi:MAG: hypothetical protein KatS3mg002_1065 [Candidatus Woesearchaeota archaeon]|jgi:hypothetical protein|nr:MAG: hypothetical protein KatS3mg002_1065 [Candidatus Woesearchaeota archaeon]
MKRLKRTAPRNELDTITCRRCRRSLVAGKNYYISFDKLLDTNGYMSVCRYCVNEITNNFYSSEKDWKKTFLLACKIFNVIYDDVYVEKTVQLMDKMTALGKPIDSPFGTYIRIVSTNNNYNINANDLTFNQPTIIYRENDTLEDYEELDIQRLRDDWGENLSEEEYVFLEEKFAKWKETTKCETYAEELLIRELCHKENEIRKARLANNPVDGLVKSLQEIMKNTALTPAIKNSAMNNRGAESFGVWIRDIETKSPAEWYNDVQKYKDMDGIGEDIEDIKRSIKNFITGSRDFNTDISIIENEYELDDTDEE